MSLVTFRGFNPSFNQAAVISLRKNTLCDLCLQLSCRPAENIKTDVELVVDAGMVHVVVIAELLGRAVLDKRSCLGRRPIFIRS